MQFSAPTSKSQMYQTLNDIFYYYRVRKDPFDELELNELELPRLSVIYLTDQKMEEKADLLLKPDQTLEINQYKDKLNQKILALNSKLNAVEPNKNLQIQQINDRYQTSIQKIERVISKNGLTGSGVALSELNKLELEKNKEISSVESKFLAQSVEYNALIEAYTAQINGADEYFEQVHNEQKLAKKSELFDEQEKLRTEVIKYNNSLDEKEQRYKNTLTQIKANARARYQEISPAAYSKDQLVEMGYYTDVISCIQLYYDTLDKVVAYEDILYSETKLIIYLDEFYSQLLYRYKLRAETA